MIQYERNSKLFRTAMAWRQDEKENKGKIGIKIKFNAMKI